MIACVDALDLRRRWRPGLLRFGDAHRRNTHLVAVGNPRVGLGALAVDAHLAGTQDPVDQALRHALELAGKKIVDALAVALARLPANQTHPGT